MSKTSAAKNALQVPELRTRIGQFISLKDAIACAQVCEDWSQDFTSQIWHTVNLEDNKQFTKLDPLTISKHGHCTCVIKNLRKADEIAALQCSSIRNLKRVSMFLQGAQSTLAQYYDILRRNNANLTHIEISVEQFNVNTRLYFPVDVLAPSASTLATSRLSDLKIQGLAMTWESFSWLLRLCPVLKTLEIQEMTLSNYYNTDHYKHRKVTYLSAQLKQIFCADPLASNPPSLLRYFPNLRSLEVSGALDIPVQVIRREVTIHCPLLSSLKTKSQSSVVASMVVGGFPHLQSICISHEKMSPEVVMSILTHQETIMRLYTYLCKADFYEQWLEVLAGLYNCYFRLVLD